MRQKLGKGLEQLLGPDEKLDSKQLKEIPVDDIHANKSQPRRHFSPEKIQELAQSIAENGLIQPIIVRQLGTDDYEIIAGERRFRACKSLNHQTIKAIVLECDAQKSFELALIENLQRDDLNPIEEARCFAELMEKRSFTQDELSKTIGKSRSYVANSLRLLQLPQKVLDLVEQRQLSAGHARTLLRNPEQAEQLALDIQQQQLTVRELEQQLISTNQYKKSAPQPKQKLRNTPLHDEAFEIATNLSEKIGFEVEIQQKTPEQGKVSLTYKNLEQLDYILQHLGALNGQNS